jgi:hypothetical protein
MQPIPVPVTADLMGRQSQPQCNQYQYQLTSWIDRGSAAMQPVPAPADLMGRKSQPQCNQYQYQLASWVDRVGRNATSTSWPHGSTEGQPQCNQYQLVSWVDRVSRNATSTSTSAHYTCNYKHIKTLPQLSISLQKNEYPIFNGRFGCKVTITSVRFWTEVH